MELIAPRSRSAPHTRPAGRRRPGLVRPHDRHRGRQCRRPRGIPRPVGRRSSDSRSIRGRAVPVHRRPALRVTAVTINTAAFGVPVGTPATVTSTVQLPRLVLRSPPARHCPARSTCPPPAPPPSTPTGADDHPTPDSERGLSMSPVLRRDHGRVDHDRRSGDRRRTEGRRRQPGRDRGGRGQPSRRQRRRHAAARRRRPGRGRRTRRAQLPGRSARRTRLGHASAAASSASAPQPPSRRSSCP